MIVTITSHEDCKYMGKIFFTSDLHFNHGNIMKFCHRPFMTKEEEDLLSQHGNFRVSNESIQRMNDSLIDSINNIVGENDTLWHLGDFCFTRGKNYYYDCLNLRNRIKCKTINLTWGNHDNRKKLSQCGFNEMHDLTRVKVNRQTIYLCHYAMLTWENSGKGTWQLYGHSHMNLEPWADRFMPGRKSLDVGVDNALRLLGEMRPFSFDEIHDLLNDRPGFSADHHYDMGNWDAYREKVGQDGSLSQS